MFWTWLCVALACDVIVSLSARTVPVVDDVTMTSRHQSDWSNHKAQQTTMVTEMTVKDDVITTSRHDRFNEPHQTDKWNKTRLTYRIVNCASSLSCKEVKSAIGDAFSVWSDVTQLTFADLDNATSDTRSATASLNDDNDDDDDGVDIVVKFVSGPHGDPYPFDGRGGVVAHAFYPGDTEHGGDIHLDNDELWTVTANRKGVSLFLVTAHELGHALGLHHSSVIGSLMSPWHRHFNADFMLHDDDVTAAQDLYGASASVRRRVFPAPTDVTTPSTTTLSTTLPPPSTTLLPPDGCHSNIDAISVIDGEVFAFKQLWFWRLGSRDTPRSKVNRSPEPLDHYWIGFPADFDRVDAVFQLPDDGRVIFFSGRRYWTVIGRSVQSSRGRPLTLLGLPVTVTYVDAAFVWGHHRRVFLVTGSKYWRLDDSRLHVVQHGFPRNVTGVWNGVELPLDAAFTHLDGQTYFFADSRYWLFDDVRLCVHDGYPRMISSYWFYCPSVGPLALQSVSDRAASLDIGHASSAFCFVTVVILLLR